MIWLNRQKSWKDPIREGKLQVIMWGNREGAERESWLHKPRSGRPNGCARKRHDDAKKNTACIKRREGKATWGAEMGPKGSFPFHVGHQPELFLKGIRDGRLRKSRGRKGIECP